MHYVLQSYQINTYPTNLYFQTNIILQEYLIFAYAYLGYEHFTR